jgi:hypothetical protein
VCFLMSLPLLSVAVSSWSLASWLGLRHTHANGTACASRSLAFLHQQKSAGMSVRTAMQEIAASRHIEFHLQPQRDGVCPACAGGGRQAPVWFYSDEAPECDGCPSEHSPQWITLFRDPWERMRSAFFYCAMIPDPLCFMPDWDPHRTPCDFGRRWGNYAFAKLSGLRWYGADWRARPCTAGLPTSASYQRETCDCSGSDTHQRATATAEHRGCPASAWCRREVISRCSLDINASFVAVVVDRLRTSFAAIGLLERLNESLALFGRVTGCGHAFTRRFMRIHYAHASLKRHASAALVRQHDAQFATCKNELLERMRLDLMLYEEAGRLMQAQHFRGDRV